MKWISVNESLPNHGIENKVLIGIKVNIDPDNVLNDPKKKYIYLTTSAYLCCTEGWKFDSPKYEEQYNNPSPFSYKQEITHWLQPDKLKD